jgi:hypothetical protein
VLEGRESVDVETVEEDPLFKEEEFEELECFRFAIPPSLEIEVLEN